MTEPIMERLFAGNRGCRNAGDVHHEQAMQNCRSLLFTGDCSFHTLGGPLFPGLTEKRDLEDVI